MLHTTPKLFLMLIMLCSLPNLVFSNNTNLMGACDYTLELFDSFGDGWNGASLTVSVNGVENTYSVAETTATFVIDADAGDQLTFTYQAGFWENEVSYNILNVNGDVVFAEGAFPSTGLVFQTAACTDCLGVDEMNLSAISGTSATVNWTPFAIVDGYVIEYGVSGFVLGNGTVTSESNPETTMSALTEYTTYDVYVKALCDSGEASGTIGPFKFTTDKLNDIGIVSITAPASGCDLGSEETVIVEIANFGNDPQTSFPLNFSVNGQIINSNDPLDTDILPIGGTIAYEFTATADLSQYGTYEIAAWTNMANDVDLNNDTTFLTIQNAPYINDFPYFQNFETASNEWSANGTSNQSFEFGEPTNVFISAAASGTNAWVTDLDGDYEFDELAYLESGCFDFSNLSTDPIISFALIHNLYSNWDGAWLDVSVDGGASWAKVGAQGTGLNWYNDVNTSGGGDVWTENSDGWIVAAHELTGTAGVAEVRLRFAFDTNDFGNTEGIGIDDISISIPVANDLSAQNIMSTSNLECGTPNDQITIDIFNNGTVAHSNFEVAYQIDGNTVVETVNQIVAPFESITYTFMETFNSNVGGEINIIAWSELPNEMNFNNDTTTTSLQYVLLAPFQEDFEIGVTPPNWTSTGEVGNGHGNTSFVAYDNVYGTVPTFDLTSPAMGTIQEGDSLLFDYRYVNWGNSSVGTELSVGDMLEIQASTDCGMTYNTLFTIDQSNHTTSNEMATMNIDISSLTGQIVKFKFLATWGSGDYYVDIDNINVYQCSGLNVSSEFVGASSSTAADGNAWVAVEGNSGPYTFLWNTGETTQVINGLAVGVYSVIITDNFGCTEEVIFDIGVPTIEVNHIESLNLYPNPTFEVATLDLNLNEAVDVEIQLSNAIGQVMFKTTKLNTTQESIQLDLQNYPSGMFFVAVKIGEQIRIEKLLKN